MFQIIEKNGLFYISDVYGSFCGGIGFADKSRAELAAKSACTHFAALQSGAARAPSHGGDI